MKWALHRLVGISWRMCAVAMLGVWSTAASPLVDYQRVLYLTPPPTFNEADHGFRAFGELLRHLAEHNIVELIEGPAKGDPEVTLPEHGDREAAFSLLRSVVVDLAGSDGSVALSGLKNQLRKVRPDFSEKKLGYRSFLQFCKAAATAGAVDLQWSSDADDYLLTANTQT